MEYHVDLTGRTLGRAASDISLILQGKKSASYAPHRLSGDKVYVKNVDGIKVTGSKETDKIYYRHTGYVGHLKKLTYEQKFAKDPRAVLRRAVRKMLPRNFLTQKRMNNLIFE